MVVAVVVLAAIGGLLYGAAGKKPAPRAAQSATAKPASTPVVPAGAVNVLSDAERAAGWRLLFDGSTLAGWHLAPKWEGSEFCRIEEGSLRLSGLRGYLMTEEKFDSFELALQWRVSPGGNGGILFRFAGEDSVPTGSGLEMQVGDDAIVRDPKQLSGAAFALYAPSTQAARPVGQWNDTRVLVRGEHVEHWLNGTKVVEYDTDSPDFKLRATNPDRRRQRPSRIALQGWLETTWYRDIKIRPLAGAPAKPRPGR